MHKCGFDPVRLPLRTAAPRMALRPLPSPGTGLPPLPASPLQHAVPTTPTDRAGTRVDCFPARAAFPVMQAGRHPHHHFRDLLRLHTRYGPLDRSTAQGGICHEASARPVTRQSRSSATRPIDNYLGGTFLHWCYAPSGRTELMRLTKRRSGGRLQIGMYDRLHRNTQVRDRNTISYKGTTI